MPKNVDDVDPVSGFSQELANIDMNNMVSAICSERDDKSTYLLVDMDDVVRVRSCRISRVNAVFISDVVRAAVNMPFVHFLRDIKLSLEQKNGDTRQVKLVVLVDVSRISADACYQYHYESDVFSLSLDDIEKALSCSFQYEFWRVKSDNKTKAFIFNQHDFLNHFPGIKRIDEQVMMLASARQQLDEVVAILGCSKLKLPQYGIIKPEKKRMVKQFLEKHSHLGARLYVDFDDSLLDWDGTFYAQKIKLNMPLVELLQEVKRRYKNKVSVVGSTARNNPALQMALLNRRFMKAYNLLKQEKNNDYEILKNWKDSVTHLLKTSRQNILPKVPFDMDKAYTSFKQHFAELMVSAQQCYKKLPDEKVKTFLECGLTLFMDNLDLMAHPASSSAIFQALQYQYSVDLESKWKSFCNANLPVDADTDLAIRYPKTTKSSVILEYLKKHQHEVCILFDDLYANVADCDELLTHPRFLYVKMNLKGDGSQARVDMAVDFILQHQIGQVPPNVDSVFCAESPVLFSANHDDEGKQAGVLPPVQDDVQANSRPASM